MSNKYDIAHYDQAYKSYRDETKVKIIDDKDTEYTGVVAYFDKKELILSRGKKDVIFQHHEIKSIESC